MAAEDRLRHRRLLRPLLRRQRLSRGTGLRDHHVPELGEVVRRGAAFQPVLQRVGQVLVGGMHVAELRLAERLAVAHRHMPRVQDVGERDVVAVRHVGVPALAGIVGADLLSVLLHVGQDHHLGMVRLVVGVGDVDLEFAEAAAEGGELIGVQCLAREAQHAVFAQRAQDRAEVAVRQRHVRDRCR